MKKGNSLYQNESYREALAQFQKGLELDPTATFAWRSVGLSAMALYRPGADTEENKRYGEVAIAAFQNYLQAFPDDHKVDEYLTTMLVNADRHQEALARLEQRAKDHPGDAPTEKAIETLLIKAKRLPEALARARRAGPRPDPQVLYSIGVAAWATSYGDPTIGLATRTAIVDLGIDAMSQALQVKPDYFEAMAYINLLYREKAKVNVDYAEAQKWIAKAEEWTAKALALRASLQQHDTAKPRS
jgi:tetratricopeptide (TPR) repeat protein